MRNKMMTLLMVFLMALCTTSMISAKDLGDQTITPLWENITLIKAYLDRSGYAEGEVSLVNGNYLYVRLELQEKNGVRWESTGDYNVGSGFGDCRVTDYFVLDDGVQYRAKVTVNVYDSSYQLIESDTEYSAVITG